MSNTSPSCRLSVETQRQDSTLTTLLPNTELEPNKNTLQLNNKNRIQNKDIKMSAQIFITVVLI